jgi:uncharacterized integral membrane protein
VWKEQAMPADLDDSTEKQIRARQTVRILAIVVLAGILALWAFANTDEVDVDWLVTTTSGPLVVVIAISALIGFLLGAVATWRQGR